MQCNTEAAKIDEWFKANRLTTNSKKASNFLLSEYYKDNLYNSNSFNIIMGNVSLRRVDNVKYLGVILDANVTWTDQIEYLASKLSRSSGIFLSYVITWIIKRSFKCTMLFLILICSTEFCAGAPHQ